jgi:hypothetical protein
MWASAFKWGLPPKPQTDAVHRRLRGVWVCLGLLTAVSACDDEARAKQRAEAERVVQAVRAVRALDSKDKAAGLDRLRQQACEIPKIRELRDACAEGYALHQRGHAAAKALSADLARDAGIDGAAAQLALAEKDLAASRVKTRRCADLEGEIVREYGLN